MPQLSRCTVHAELTCYWTETSSVSPAYGKKTCSRQVAYFNCRRDATGSCKAHRLNKSAAKIACCGYRFDLLIHSSARHVTKGGTVLRRTAAAIGRCRSHRPE